MEYSIGSAALVSYPVECPAYSRIDLNYWCPVNVFTRLHTFQDCAIGQSVQ